MWYGRIRMINNENEEGIATLHRAEYVVSDSEFELIQDTAKDLGQFLVQLGRQIRLDRGDSDD